MEGVGGQGALKKSPGGAALLEAGVEDRPDPRVPFSAHRRVPMYIGTSINHRDADTSFGGVVRRRMGWSSSTRSTCLPAGRSDPPETANELELLVVLLIAHARPSACILAKISACKKAESMYNMNMRGIEEEELVSCRWVCCPARQISQGA